MKVKIVGDNVKQIETGDLIVFDSRKDHITRVYIVNNEEKLTNIRTGMVYSNFLNAKESIERLAETGYVKIIERNTFDLEVTINIK